MPDLRIGKVALGVYHVESVPANLVQPHLDLEVVEPADHEGVLPEHAGGAASGRQLEPGLADERRRRPGAQCVLQHLCGEERPNAVRVPPPRVWKQILALLDDPDLELDGLAERDKVILVAIPAVARQRLKVPGPCPGHGVTEHRDESGGGQHVPHQPWHRRKYDVRRRGVRGVVARNPRVERLWPEPLLGSKVSAVAEQVEVVCEVAPVRR